MPNTAMTAEQLMEVMKFHLSNFDDEGVVINNDTVHNTVLSDSDSLTPQTCSMNVYHGLIIWTINKNGGVVKTWPNNWMTLSVNELAVKLV